MADKLYRHPAGTAEEPSTLIHVTLRDESDGTFGPVHRARMEVWDAVSATWIKARANQSGALLLDRGTAGADISATGTYTASQSGTVLASATTAQVAHVTAVMVAYGNGGSASPAASVSVGSNVVAKHPGIPAGGGYALTDIDLSGVAGDDITFTCDAPTGASISVVVHYYMGET